MSESINIKRSIEIEVSADDLWHKTAEDFGGIDQWISVVSNVTHIPNENGDALGAERVCRSPFGDTRETMVTYDETERTFGYAIQGLPPFISEAVNTWRIEAVNHNTSLISMTLTGNVVEGVDPEMVIGFKSQVGDLIGMATEELKHWVETGTAHPRKVDAIAAAQ